jgi:hypothetical protein
MYSTILTEYKIGLRVWFIGLACTRPWVWSLAHPHLKKAPLEYIIKSHDQTNWYRKIISQNSVPSHVKGKEN